MFLNIDLLTPILLNVSFAYKVSALFFLIITKMYFTTEFIVKCVIIVTGLSIINDASFLELFTYETLT